MIISVRFGNRGAYTSCSNEFTSRRRNWTKTHTDNDQVLFCVSGTGKVVLNGEETSFQEGDLVLVHSGTLHNFINSGTTSMKIITTYSPSHHPQGTIHKTKAEAEK